METRSRGRNNPPEHSIRVPAAALERFVASLFERAGMPPGGAAVMAKLLVDTDLHCVYSHGTRQTVGYIRMIQEGRVNPTPDIRTDADFPAGLVLDGDGGMGHLPCYRATRACIDKAKKVGVAAATTRNHFHFGAAGKYTRMAVAAGCVGISMSSHRFYPDPNGDQSTVSRGSPMSIGIPAGEQPPLVLDMGAFGLPATEQMLNLAPGAVFRALGLGMSVVSLGGILPGVYREQHIPPTSRWESNQGAIIVVLDVARFMPLDELKGEMDRYVGTVRSLKPLPGQKRASTAGSVEWEWAAENRREGIPVGEEHREQLTVLADELGVEAPFEEFAGTRF